jgi:sugar phosphate isomerase/epimerase
MVMTTRRSALMGLASAASVFSRPGGGFPGPLGLELYSLRREVARSLPDALAFARKVGFDELELPQLYGLTASRFRAELDKAGLKCTSLAADEVSIRRSVPAIVEDARVLGAGYIVLGWINHEKPFGLSGCQRAIGDFNRWGEQFRAAGLQFCYHTHGFEFGPGPGGTLFDTMVERTKPEYVHYEMDVFWLVWPGQDPVHYLRRYPGRFSLMHLKDLRKGVTGSETQSAPSEDSVAVGSGSIDFPSILREARKAGVKRYYIEDESPVAAAQVPASFSYLKSIRL